MSTAPQATGADRALADSLIYVGRKLAANLTGASSEEWLEEATKQVAAHVASALSAQSAQSAEVAALRATVVRLNGALRQLLGAVNTCDFSFGRAQEWQTEEWITNGKQAAREALSLVPSDLADCVVVKRSERIHELELLKAAACPVSDSEGHEEAWQCQWCDERKAAVAELTALREAGRK